MWSLFSRINKFINRDTVDNSCDNTSEILDKLGLSYDTDDIAVVKYVCEVVSNRAALLVSICEFLLRIFLNVAVNFSHLFFLLLTGVVIIIIIIFCNNMLLRSKSRDVRSVKWVQSRQVNPPPPRLKLGQVNLLKCMLVCMCTRYSNTAGEVGSPRHHYCCRWLSVQVSSSPQKFDEQVYSSACSREKGIYTFWR
jgi:hypothetical protein